MEAEADVALVPLDTLSSEEDAALEVVDVDDWDSFCPCPLPLIPFELLFINIRDMRLLPPPSRVVDVPPNISGIGGAPLDWASAGTTCAIDPNPAAMNRLMPCTPPFMPSSIPSTLPPGATPAVAVDDDALDENEYGWKAELGEEDALVVVVGRVNVVVGEVAEVELELDGEKVLSKPRLTMRSHLRLTR